MVLCCTRLRFAAFPYQAGQNRPAASSIGISFHLFVSMYMAPSAPHSEFVVNQDIKTSSVDILLSKTGRNNKCRCRHHY